jgi:hypothetical protein
MSNNILVFFGWRVKYITYTRIRATCLAAQKICSLYNLNPVFVFVNEKAYKECEDILKSFHYKDYYIFNPDVKNWNDAQQEVIALAQYNFKYMLVSSLPILKSYRLGNEESFKNELEEFYKDEKRHTKMMILFTFFRKMFFVYDMLKKLPNIKVLQYLDDPWELNLSKIVQNECKTIYEYNLSDRTVDFTIPFIGYTFFYNDSFTCFDDKKYDFTTGFMVPYEHIDRLKKNQAIEKRVQYAIKIKDIENQFTESKLKFNLFYNLKSKTIENKVIKDVEYNALIGQSRFSFIFPSPKTNEFAITRLYYSLVRDCIPFIDTDTNLECGLFKDNPELLEFFKSNNLIQDLTDIPKILPVFHYESIKMKLHNLNFFKQLQDKSYYDIQFSKMRNFFE